MATPLTNTDSEFRAQLAPFLGSFWTSVFPAQDQVAALLGLSQKTSASQTIRAMIQNMVGNLDAAALVENMEVSFRDRDVTPTGMQLFDDPDLQLDFETIQNSLNAFNFSRINYFVLPVQNVIPYSIESTGGKLNIGVDFFVVQEQFIFFRQDPRILFPNRIYSVAAGKLVQLQTSIGFFIKLPIFKNVSYVVDYLRNKQTPKTFELALAAAGELQILHSAQKLIAAVPTVWGVIYTFENETLRVDYEHTPLIPGTNYPANYIVGDGVQVVSQTTGQQGWWRSIDWKGGISLDPILNDFRGLSLLNETTVAYSAGSDPGSTNGNKLHARIALTDNFTFENPYWAYVSDRETNMGIYLNSFLQFPEDAPGETTLAELVTGSAAANLVNERFGYPLEQPDVASLPNSKLVNAMDVFFQVLLGGTAFAVILDHNQIKNVPQLYAFLSREMLIGGVPIIFDKGPDLQIDVVQNGVNLTVVESVDIEFFVTDTVDVVHLNSVSDLVMIRQLPPIFH